MKNSKLISAVLLIVVILAGVGYWGLSSRQQQLSTSTTGEPSNYTTESVSLTVSSMTYEPLIDKVTEAGFNFSSFSTEHAQVMFENNVSIEYAVKTANYFEFARSFVGRDFGIYPPRIFKIYIFFQQKGLVRGLIKLAGYSSSQAHFFDKEGVIPMPIDWVQYMTTILDMRSFCHEYTHVMIEELTGKGTRSAFKWLDEGLAEYEGNTCRAQWYRDAANSYWYTRRGIVLDSYRNGSLFKLEDLQTEPEWSNRIQQSDFEFDLEYAEALTAVTRLVEMQGFSRILNFLHKGWITKIFAIQFKNTFGISLEDFQKEFVTYVDEQSRLPPPEFLVTVHLSKRGIAGSTYICLFPSFANLDLYYATSSLKSGEYTLDILPDGTVQSLDSNIRLRKYQYKHENYSFLYVGIYSTPMHPNGGEMLAVYVKYGVAVPAFRYYWYSNTSTYEYMRDYPLDSFPDGNSIGAISTQSLITQTATGSLDLAVAQSQVRHPDNRDITSICITNLFRIGRDRGSDSGKIWSWILVTRYEMARPSYS